jgi:hypothetical protein
MTPTGYKIEIMDRITSQDYDPDVVLFLRDWLERKSLEELKKLWEDINGSDNT